MYLELLFGKRTLSLLSAVAVGALLLSSSAYADVTVNHSDRGGFFAQFAHANFGGVNKHPVYDVGNINTGSGVTSLKRNYHVFDLSGHSGMATSATLEIFSGGYASLNPAGRDLDLVSVSTSAVDLSSAPGTSVSYDSTIFDDLAAGTSYGTLTMTPADAGSFISVVLNAAALADINAAIASGSWAIGGSLSTTGTGSAAPALISGGGSPFPSEAIFLGASSAPPSRLVLAGVVPEPTSVLLMLLAIGGAATCGGRRR